MTYVWQNAYLGFKWSCVLFLMNSCYYLHDKFHGFDLIRRERLTWGVSKHHTYCIRRLPVMIMDSIMADRTPSWHLFVRPVVDHKSADDLRVCLTGGVILTWHQLNVTHVHILTWNHCACGGCWYVMDLDDTFNRARSRSKSSYLKWSRVLRIAGQQ